MCLARAWKSMNVGLLACRDERTRAPSSLLLFFGDLFLAFLSSTILCSLPTVLSFLLLTSCFTLSLSIRLIAKQQWQPWQICALAHTVSHLTLAYPLLHKHTYTHTHTTKCPAGLWFMILNPPSKWLPGQHPLTEVTGGKRPAGWNCCVPPLRALILCPSSPKSEPALPAWRGGWLATWFSCSPYPLGRRSREARVLVRYVTYLCAAVHGCVTAGTRWKPPPTCLPALTSP